MNKVTTRQNSITQARAIVGALTSKEIPFRTHIDLQLSRIRYVQATMVTSCFMNLFTSFAWLVNADISYLRSVNVETGAPTLSFTFIYIPLPQHYSETRLYWRCITCTIESWSPLKASVARNDINTGYFLEFVLPEFLLNGNYWFDIEVKFRLVSSTCDMLHNVLQFSRLLVVCNFDDGMSLLLTHETVMVCPVCSLCYKRRFI